MRVLRLCTAVVIAIKLDTLCQHRTNASTQKTYFFDINMYHWTDCSKHLDIRIAPHHLLALKPSRNQNWIFLFFFFWYIWGKNRLSWKQLNKRKYIRATPKKNSQERLVLQRNDKNLYGLNENRTLDCTKSISLKTYLFMWRASPVR